MGKLKNKIALVTGGGSGIGRGVAKVFAQEGAEVVVSGRTEMKLQETCQEISQKGGECHGYVADLSNPTRVGHLKEYIEKRFGRLDILVNNAGILGPMISIENYPLDEWDRVLRFNLNTVFLVSQKMIPLLRRGEDPVIMNVSSTVGSEGRAGWGAYSVSKFGTEALTQILAQELQPDGIRVYSINPGGTRTKMRAEAYPEEDPRTLPTPEEVAQAFLYLASQDSALMTGQLLQVRTWLKKHRHPLSQVMSKNSSKS